ncbi:MAG: hypothetical protein S4CHLAM7_11510 [Chlamydiae bacterium]|nr:hypothetical protein [Chlamydiota bacterium]
MTLQTYVGFKNHPVYYLGADIQKKEYPTLLYFSLSGPESLTLSPYNQIASELAQENCRVLSVTLPGHHEGQDKHKAMDYWAKNLEELDFFLKDMHELLSDFFEKGWIESNRFAVAGLSRGGWIATHLLSHPQVKIALGLAPVTDLSFLSEFNNDSPLLEKLSLHHLYDQLVGKTLRYYIGNRDLKVGTKESFEFTQKLTEIAYNQRVRSPEVELIISPSTGHFGHGTLPGTFHSAACWLKKKIVE